KTRVHNWPVLVLSTNTQKSIFSFLNFFFWVKLNHEWRIRIIARNLSYTGKIKISFLVLNVGSRYFGKCSDGIFIYNLSLSRLGVHLHQNGHILFYIVPVSTYEIVQLSIIA